MLRSFHLRFILPLLAALLLAGGPVQAEPDHGGRDALLEIVPNDDIHDDGANLAELPPYQPAESFDAWLAETHAALAQTVPTYPIFGVETNSGRLSNANVTRRARELGATWVRLNTLSWRDIQPDSATPPEQWNWDAASVVRFEAELTATAEANLTPMVIVDDYPRWATIAPNACSEIRADRFADYGRFLAELVKRYPSVLHWELGNEVDIDPRLVQPDNIFGCWGDIDDPYYNGESYGEMLKVVAPFVRAANPNVKIIIGGLLLDRPDTRIVGRGKPERFFEGILRAGAGDSFDIVGVHAYPWFEAVGADSDLNDPRWQAWGGVTFGKVQFLRNVMQQYGVDKPIFMNETSLLLNTEFHNDTFFDEQANHIVRTTVRALSVGVQAYCWYTLHESGWLSAGLLDRSNQPRAPYRAYRELIRQAGQQRTLQRITSYGEGVEAYRFDRGTSYVDVLWSRNTTTQQVQVLSPAFLNAFSRDGDRITPQTTAAATIVPVGFRPVYIHSISIDTARLPQLTSISPSEGNNSSTTRITLTGSNFIQPLDVRLGDRVLGNVQFVSSTTLTADVPTGLNVGSYDVSVINPGGWAATRTRAFTVLSSSPPAITDIRPTAGQVGRSQRIHIYGSNFAAGVQARLGTVALAAQRVNGSHVILTLPADALAVGDYTVTLVNPDQSSARGEAAFTIYSPLQPTFDLRGSPDDLWTRPATVRVGQPFQVGQVVERIGNTSVITPEVRFQATGVGESTMNPRTVSLALQDRLFGEASITERIIPTTGAYTLRATIDPNNQLSELDRTNNVITRQITVLPTDIDQTSPAITGLQIAGGARITRNQTIDLALEIEDAAPSSGMAGLYIVEYEYHWGAERWIAVQRSQDWFSYRVGQPLSWTFIPTAGLKFVQVWAADRAGNIANAQSVWINYVPDTVPIVAGGVEVYRLSLAADEALSLTLTPNGGAVDFYIWSPGAATTLAASGRTDTTYQLTIPSLAAGTYQIEIHGRGAASYTFDVTADAPASQVLAQPDPLRAAPVVAVSSNPSRNFAVPPVPLGERVIRQVYLPLVVRGQ
ncbi:MAG: cellulase family glycosylhydrolase [Chloroflexaceae bacterium]|nr:cellulase family glycosylhydrolase [Chloroflexaceae bacterium]